MFISLVSVVPISPFPITGFGKSVNRRFDWVPTGFRSTTQTTGLIQKPVSMVGTSWRSDARRTLLSRPQVFHSKCRSRTVGTPRFSESPRGERSKSTSDSSPGSTRRVPSVGRWEVWSCPLDLTSCKTWVCSPLSRPSRTLQVVEVMGSRN